jgi:L-fuconolactonase
MVPLSLVRALALGTVVRWGMIGRVIDAHHHLLDPARVAYPDIERVMPEINQTFSAADLAPLLSEARVDGTIVVQAANEMAETSMLLDLARRTDWIRGVVGWVPLQDADATAAAIAKVDDERLLGVRTLLHRESDPQWLSAPARLDALRVLAECSLVFDALTLAKGHLDNIPTVLERVPELTLVIDHLGSPFVRGDRWEPWASLMSAAAQHERCFVKYSSLDPIDGSVEPLRPYVEHVFSEFGTDRVMWASNWPATRRGASYRAMLDDARALLPRGAESEIDAVFGDNARRVYGLSA